MIFDSLIHSKSVITYNYAGCHIILEPKVTNFDILKKSAWAIRSATNLQVWARKRFKLNS